MSKPPSLIDIDNTICTTENGDYAIANSSIVQLIR